MPKLIMFTPCEKIIIDDNNTASLIAIMHGVTASSPADKEIPKNAVAPKEWAIYTSWMREQGDETKSFEQKLQILWPDGTEFHVHSLPFKIPESIHQNRVGVIGFPIGQRGPLKVKMWVESGGTKISETYHRTIEVKHESK